MAIAEQIQIQLQSLPTAKQIEVLDFIALLHQKLQTGHSLLVATERKQRIKKAFETLAAMETFADIKDPVEWQRQIRQDRQLLGRLS